MYPTRLTCRKREVALKFQGNLYNLLLALKSDSMIIGSQPFHSTYTFYNELGRYVSQMTAHVIIRYIQSIRDAKMEVFPSRRWVLFPKKNRNVFQKEEVSHVSVECEEKSLLSRRLHGILSSHRASRAPKQVLKTSKYSGALTVSNGMMCSPGRLRWPITSPPVSKADYLSLTVVITNKQCISDGYGTVMWMSAVPLSKPAALAASTIL